MNGKEQYKAVCWWYEQRDTCILLMYIVHLVKSLFILNMYSVCQHVSSLSYSDGEVLVGTAQSAYSVQQLIHSVATLWDMQMPPEFVSVIIVIL